MIRTLVWTVSAWLLAAGTTWGQACPPNEAGVTMGHWHLNSRDVEASKRIFVGMGGTAIKPGDFEIVRFPGVAVYLHQCPGAPLATGGTVGSVVNHVGFIVQNVQESRRQVEGRWRTGGTRKQQQAGSGLRHDT
jgi:hypothetical protein